MRRPGQRGFTLLEVIIVISMMSIMMMTAYYYMGNKGDKAQLKSVARDLTSNMNLARTRAIRDTRPWAIQFNPGANSYVVISDSGEPYAPEDPADPVTWGDGDDTVFRTITLPQNVSFGSNQGELNAVAIGDGVSYPNDRIVFNPNGTSSDTGTVYLTVPSGITFAVSTLAATGRIKIWHNYGSGWSN
ncbi:MAG: prepilin-type N-terminal cleavage/methylation domain-containing protein [Desulfuromonadaceae bacterium]|nr:prepilin-type N-terminal cleavage/methylation domain-containing protein [Desulfuromonadaceae bacterium]